MRPLVCFLPRRFMLACFVAGTLILTPALPKTFAQKAPEKDAVRPLLKERLALLSKIHDFTLRGFKGGQLSYDKVLDAQAALLKGKLDLCETRAERIAAHEEMVKVAEEGVTAVRKLADDKQAAGIDLLKAEVQLLEARIGLEKAKAGG